MIKNPENNNNGFIPFNLENMKMNTNINKFINKKFIKKFY